jgi:hypothetical protein
VLPADEARAFIKPLVYRYFHGNHGVIRSGLLAFAAAGALLPMGEGAIVRDPPSPGMVA